ncbi:MAG TPA: hypothetical protein EYP85_00620 [Armatimonadetes bacterium]|nr:hypothetical protein [Armatimonadota bacterium]
MSEPNYYAILQVSPRASEEEIKRQYRRLARQYHPDLQPTEEARQEAEVAMKRLNEAYSVLRDPERRRLYNRQRGIGGCAFHAGREATATCAACRRPICVECTEVFERLLYCPTCFARLQFWQAAQQRLMAAQRRWQEARRVDRYALGAPRRTGGTSPPRPGRRSPEEHLSQFALWGLLCTAVVALLALWGQWSETATLAGWIVGLALSLRLSFAGFSSSRTTSIPSPRPRPQIPPHPADREKIKSRLSACCRSSNSPPPG